MEKDKAVETAVVEKQEAALDNLFPKSEGAPSEVEQPAVLAGVETKDCQTKEPSLIEQIASIRASLSERVKKLNVTNTKDGSRSDVAAVHGTRLIQRFNVVDGELKSFAEFLAKEGHE